MYDIIDIREVGVNWYHNLPYVRSVTNLANLDELRA